MLGRIETGRLLCSVPSLNYHRGQYIAPCVPAFDFMPRLKRHGKAVFSGAHVVGKMVKISPFML
jgi:hypothetical protein